MPGLPTRVNSKKWFSAPSSSLFYPGLDHRFGWYVWVAVACVVHWTLISKKTFSVTPSESLALAQKSYYVRHGVSISIIRLCVVFHHHTVLSYLTGEQLERPPQSQEDVWNICYRTGDAQSHILYLCNWEPQPLNHTHTAFSAVQCAFWSTYEHCTLHLQTKRCYFSQNWNKHDIIINPPPATSMAPTSNLVSAPQHSVCSFSVFRTKA